MILKPRLILMVTLVAGNGSTWGGCNSAIPRDTPDGAFTVHNNATVTHSSTGLMWMRCLLGQTWNGLTCNGSALTYTWQRALQVADSYKFAGYSDWRLPNKNELASIIEYACENPSINMTVFPNASASAVWSSTPADDAELTWSVDLAWAVYFLDGYVFHRHRSGNYQVRLVRSGQ